MKNKDIVEILSPIHKINKVCAIHYAALKNGVKKDVFSYSYANIQSLMSNVVKGIKLDKIYFKDALVDYYLLKTNLDIAHEVGAISNGLFADIIQLLSDIYILLQSYTDEDNII